MTTIFDALTESHEKQRILLDAILQTSAGSEARASFYQDLKSELAAHAAAEERHFYAPLIQSDNSIDLTRHGIAEHHVIDKIIAQLDDTDYNSSAWLTLAKKLKHKVLHHLEEEEQRFFQIAGKVLTSEEKVSLGEAYNEEMVS